MGSMRGTQRGSDRTLPRRSFPRFYTFFVKCLLYIYTQMRSESLPVKGSGIVLSLLSDA